MTLAEQVLDACRKRGLKLAAAESCTGGMVMAALTDIPGSSDVVERGFVTYSNEAKQEMLGVKSETLATYGAVSIETAREMAQGALANSRADIAVSITGVAGPGGSEAKPEGLVCFARAQKGMITKTERHEFGAIGRGNVRQKSVENALEMILRVVQSD
jgi:nicotinamide-nucleotide amidase